MSDAPANWLTALGGAPSCNEILDTIVMVEAALASMVHRRDRASAALRHEINMRAREPLLHLWLRAGREAQLPASEGNDD